VESAAATVKTTTAASVTSALRECGIWRAGERTDRQQGKQGFQAGGSFHIEPPPTKERERLAALAETYFIPLETVCTAHVAPEPSKDADSKRW
jgi:hypothetical protein